MVTHRPKWQVNPAAQVLSSWHPKVRLETSLHMQLPVSAGNANSAMSLANLKGWDRMRKSAGDVGGDCRPPAPLHKVRGSREGRYPRTLCGWASGAGARRA